MKRFLQVSLVMLILAVPVTATAEKGGNGGPQKPPPQPAATVLTVFAPTHQIRVTPPEESLCFGNPPGRFCVPAAYPVTWLSARLTTTSGSPVDGYRPIVLRATAGPAAVQQCTGYTNASGYAACRVFGVWTSASGNFAGDASYAPSSGTYQGTP